MQKNQTVMNTSYGFSLVSLRAECHYKSILADFTPPLTLNKASNSIVPAFLQDGNFFTQAFILPREKQEYTGTSAVERVKFNSRIQKANQLDQDPLQAGEGLVQMSPPVPTTKYCQVCKCAYKEYQDHLNESAHRRQARFSKANTYISQLCKIYSKKCVKPSAKAKGKPIQKTIPGPNPKNTKPKKGASKGVENGAGTKLNNCSTNIPSVMPTPCL